MTRRHVVSREESLLVPEPGPGVTEAGGCLDVVSGFLLPSQRFPGTLHFPNVSSFVVVSWYQLEEFLEDA